VPRTFACGKALAKKISNVLEDLETREHELLEEGDAPKSVAQIPVPVARSRTLCNGIFSIGARCNLPFKASINRWCCKSNLSCSV